MSQLQTRQSKRSTCITYKRKLVYNICLISICHTVSDELQKQTLRILKLNSTIKFKPDHLLDTHLCDAGLKAQSFEVISPRILHPKNQNPRQVLSSRSSFDVCSQFVSSEIPSLHSRILMKKTLNNDVDKDSSTLHNRRPKRKHLKV